MAISTQAPAPYDLHPSVAYVQAVLDHIGSKTGRPAEAWIELLKAEGPPEAKAQVAWLKERGLGTTQAGLIAHRANAVPGQGFDDTPEGYLVAAPDYVNTQYSGKKAALRPLFERIAALARSLGPDVMVCPCQTIVPFYRNHVFAEVKPFTSRLDLGLALGDPAALGEVPSHLKDTGGFQKKDRITHKVEVRSEADLQRALPWLERAYARDDKG